MKCPECEKSGLTSTITLIASTSTLKYAPTFWDKDGNLHCHDANVYQNIFECSAGHRWSETIDRGCWCGWPETGDHKNLGLGDN